MTALARLYEELPPHQVADLLARNPEDDLLLPLVASWIGDEPPFTRAQELLNAAAAVRSERKPPHPAVAAYVEGLQWRIAHAENVRDRIKRNQFRIAEFFCAVDGRDEKLSPHAAMATTNHNGLTEKVSQITQLLGVDPTSRSYPRAAYQVYTWRVSGFSFKLRVTK